ncbi:MAG: SDR family oxidoreductase [Myxococcota bacterium]
MNKKLNGQVAVVTGGSSGIGRCIAIGRAADGATVMVNYFRQPEMAEEVVKHIVDHGGQALAHETDVSDEAAVQEMFRRLEAECGGVDILVNNAGLQQDAAFEDMTLEQWDRVIGVNLTGQFLCAREAVRAFKRQGFRSSKALGKILCISSVHEVIPWAGHINYAASKGGVMLMMKSLAQEVGPVRIRVNSIAPGAIRTPINREVWDDPEALDNLMKLIPLKRIGESDDISRAAAWICSDEADYVHGTSFFVDGGMTLYPGFADNG